MLQRILITALVSGFLGGIAITLVQQFTTTPLVFHAEQYENVSLSKTYSRITSGGQEAFYLKLIHGNKGPNNLHSKAKENWLSPNGLERLMFSTLANLLTSIGFALILTGCFALSRRRVDGQVGVLWGLAGFAALSLAPALGLPPELPGTVSADLSDRQAWWIFCVASTCIGLWVLVFRSGSTRILIGVALIALPHLTGAPQPDRIGGPIPPEISAHFVSASIVTSALFWASTGWIAGRIWQKL
tara:strand:+ start:820 stop:1551 length:732 start_codon:yes stop_codon:yes gene_type:complete